MALRRCGPRRGIAAECRQPTGRPRRLTSLLPLREPDGRVVEAARRGNARTHVGLHAVPSVGVGIDSAKNPANKPGPWAYGGGRET
jgi:hypothetical protein